MFAFPLAFLGLPLYIHLPKFYHDYFGISLSSIGIILFASRMFDAFLDPLLGIASDKFGLTRKKFFIIFSIGLVIFFNGYFYVPKVESETITLCWFAICTFFVYIFFSLLYINFYSLGLGLAHSNSLRIKISSFREFFSFLGMITAAVLPSIFIMFLNSEITAFMLYGICFGVFVFVALFFLPTFSINKKPVLENHTVKNYIDNLKYVFKNKSMTSLIVLFFINSLPVGITSNLFSFYVDETLKAKPSTSFFLILYLLCASISAVLFSVFFKNVNKLYALFGMMSISAIGFSFTYFLNAENSYFFYGICVLSGIGLGGEVVILPALAAEALEDHSAFANTFFGLWASCTKISLAVAAGIFLPLVSNSEKYLHTIPLGFKISFFYAIIPLIIKCISIAIVFSIRSKILKGATP